MLYVIMRWSKTALLEYINVVNEIVQIQILIEPVVKHFSNDA